MKRIVRFFALPFTALSIGFGAYAGAQTFEEGDSPVAAENWEQRHALFAAITENGRKGFIRRSVDEGATWETVWDAGLHARSRESRLTDIVYGKGRVVAVGNTIVVSGDGGATWKEILFKTYEKEQTFVSNRALKTVAFGGGLFVTAGPKQVLYSSDGLFWRYVRTAKLSAAERRRRKAKIKGEYPPDITKNLLFPLDIVYAGGSFFVSGGSRDGTVAVYSIAEERLVLDKRRKLIKEYGDAAKLPSGGMKSIAYNGRSGLLAISNGRKYMYSTDLGATWSFALLPQRKTGAAVLFAEGKWIAAAGDGSVYTTEEIGAGWQRSNLRGTENRINDLCYGNGLLFMAGSNGTVLRSQDGINWKLVSREANGSHITGMAYADPASSTP